MLNWIAEHWDELLAVYGGLVAFSTAVVKLMKQVCLNSKKK